MMDTHVHHAVRVHRFARHDVELALVHQPVPKGGEQRLASLTPEVAADEQEPNGRGRVRRFPVEVPLLQVDSRRNDHNPLCWHTIIVDK
jgi:hypothetical protein